MRRWLMAWGCAALVAWPTMAGAAFFDRREGFLQDVIEALDYRTDGVPFEALEADPGAWKSNRATPFTGRPGALDVWVRFELPRVDRVTRVMVLAGPWERMEVYAVRDGRVVARDTQGTLTPRSARGTHVGMSPMFAHTGFVPVDLVPGTPTIAYARLQSRQAYTVIPRLRMTVWDAERVREGERRDRQLEGMYLGVMLALVLYNLGLFFIVREASYLHYVVMEAGGMLFWSVYYGITFESLWPERPTWDYHALWIALAASVAGCLQFVRHFFDSRVHFPRADRVLNVATFVSVAALLVPVLLGHDLYESWRLVLFIVGTSSISLAFGVVWMAWRRRHPHAGHFFAAAAVSFVAFLITLAQTTGFLPATDFTVHASQLGSAVTGIILSIGLGYRLRHARRALAERELAESEARRALVETHNRELEGRVAARTAELAAAREQSDALIANILPAAVVDELKAKGVSEPRRFEEATILFTDFVGFTEAVSTVPAKRLVQELDEIFRGFDEIIALHGLEKIKTIGDAYMAAAGVPTPCEDHAHRAVRAGLALVDFIAARNRDASMKWQLRVGVHSGAVVAGIVGRHKYAYDVWGDTVNLASRMESAGAPDRVNVSAYTYDLVRGAFRCEYRGKVAAKGKGEVDMYFVVGEATPAERLAEPARS